MTTLGPVDAPWQLTDDVVAEAVACALESRCRSRRGVVLFRPAAMVIGRGHNGPPRPFACPGRERCAGLCGAISVHAEARALRSAHALGSRGVMLDLVHVELGGDDRPVSCEGPSCASCAREILDAGFVAGVWLLEGEGAWRRYTASEFYLETLRRTGLPLPLPAGES